LNIVEQALAESRQRQDVRRFFHVYRNLAARRAKAESENMDHRTELCPACGQGLKWKALPEETVAICFGCGFVRVFRDQIFDHATPPGTPFLPGVTGKPRGFVAARIRNGKIVGPA
jgi:hypothetical protein